MQEGGTLHYPDRKGLDEAPLLRHQASVKEMRKHGIDRILEILVGHSAERQVAQRSEIPWCRLKPRKKGKRTRKMKMNGNDNWTDYRLLPKIFSSHRFRVWSLHEAGCLSPRSASVRQWTSRPRAYTSMMPRVMASWLMAPRPPRK